MRAVHDLAKFIETDSIPILLVNLRQNEVYILLLPLLPQSTQQILQIPAIQVSLIIFINLPKDFLQL